LGVGSICNWFGFSWGFVKAVFCYYREETLIGYWDFDARRGTMLSCIGRLTKNESCIWSDYGEKGKGKRVIMIGFSFGKGKSFFNGLFF
jgi:hypothetical protein